MVFKNIFSACLALATPALAHMQMDYPYSINDQHDPLTPDNLKDYSYTSPLNADGSNFPCKGYHLQQPIRTTATFQAGAEHNITLTGSATHGGGSCQISLSYDNGTTFRVIKSIIGACPLTPNYDFTIPSYAPSGTALFAWTWFNEVGNREMYMNCAWINVETPATTTKQKRHQFGNSAKFRRAAGLSSLNDHPTIWVANIPTQNACTTTEGSDPVFPNPGPDVQYGGSMSSSSPASPGSCDDVSNIAVSSSGTQATSSVEATSAVVTATPSSSTTTAFAFTSSSSSCSTTTTVYSTYTYTVSGSSTITPTTSSTDSTTTLTIAQATAPSTTITFSVRPTSTVTGQTSLSSAAATATGTISTANQGACGSSAMGTLKCTNNGDGFAMCNWGQWISMGAVASGTTCTGADGQATIVAADSSDASSSSSSGTSSSSSSSDSGSSTTASSSTADDSTDSSGSQVAADGNCNGAAMGSIKCTNNGQSWAMCNWSSWVAMGGVAGGMKCVGADGQGAIVAA